MRFNIAVALERKGEKVNELAKKANVLLSKFDLSRIPDNPEGHFDDCQVFYYATPDEFEEKIVGKQERPLVVAFVTPELEWIEGYWDNIEKAVAHDEKEEYYAWKEKLSALLEKHKDYAIFIAECHF